MISKIYIIGYIVIAIITYFMILIIEKITDRYLIRYEGYYLIYSILWIIYIPFILLFLIFGKISDEVVKIIKQKLEENEK